MRSDKTLRSRWPEHLIDQIVRSNFVLVVGAGVSRSCVNDRGESPPSWDELITELAQDLLTPAPRKTVRQLLEGAKYLEAAELIRATARKAGKEEDYFAAIVRSTGGGGNSADTHFQPSALHDHLMRLGPDVIVTTNYDKLLEKATRNGFNVHLHDSKNLDRDIRSGTPSLIKVHGSVDKSSEVVLTRSDYARLRRDGANVLEVLQALFLTRTALFVGYSMGDPDIQLLLENVLGARGAVPAHYLLGPSDTPDYALDVYEYCYGTALIKFQSGDYEEMRRMVELLGAEIESRRVP